MSNSNIAALPGTQNAAPAIDGAIDFREVYSLLGLRCKTAHTALRYARDGMIRSIRINARTIRYSRNSVLELIANGSAK